MDDWHGGGSSLPPGAQAAVTPDPGGHTGNTTPYEPEGSRALGGEALLYAPRDARGGGTPLPYTTRSGPVGSGTILDAAVIPS